MHGVVSKLKAKNFFDVSHTSQKLISITSKSINNHTVHEPLQNFRLK
jgi:hypothetical protein